MEAKIREIIRNNKIAATDLLLVDHQYYKLSILKQFLAQCKKCKLDIFMQEGNIKIIYSTSKSEGTLRIFPALTQELPNKTVQLHVGVRRKYDCDLKKWYDQAIWKDIGAIYKMEEAK